MNLKFTLSAVLVVAVIAIGSLYLIGHSTVFGTVSPSDITATNFTEVTASVGIQSPLFQVGGNTALGSVQTQVSTGLCNSATSTLFGVQNPFAASSTAQVYISVPLQATSSNLTVGTSTQAVGYAATTITALLGNATIATATVATFASGITVGGSGFTSAGSGTFPVVGVGPSDYVGAFSTSTYGNAGAINYITDGSLSTGVCSYKIVWTR